MCIVLAHAHTQRLLQDGQIGLGHVRCHGNRQRLVIHLGRQNTEQRRAVKGEGEHLLRG